MGSWNYTCGISNITIIPGEEVALIFVAETTGRTENNPNITGNATPVSFPIFCTYEDYGNFSPLKSENPLAELASNYIQEHIHTPDEVSVTENNSFEGLVNLSENNKLLLNGICFSEDRKYNNKNTQESYSRNVFIFPIIKSIYDNIISNKFYDTSVFIDEEIGIENLEACQVLTRHIEIIKNNKVFNREQALYELYINKNIDEKEKEKKRKEINDKGDKYSITDCEHIFQNIDGYGPKAGIKDLVRVFIWDKIYKKRFFHKSYEAKNINKIEDTLNQRIKELFFLSFAMESMRLPWSPVGGLGGQDINLDAIIKKSKIILEYAEDKKSEFGNNIWEQ